MWDRTGEIIHGSYLGQFPYRGVVSGSRVKLGGEVQHSVALLDPIQVFGEERTAILILESDIFFVDSHVEFCYD